MSEINAYESSAMRPRPSGRGKEAAGQFRLVRFCHIFASLVRDIFEAKFLSETTPNPLSLSQFHVLKLIGLNGAHQVGEVASCLGVSPPAATKSINKLENLGLIERSPSKGDRRATLLSASPEGRKLVAEYEALKTDRLTPVLEEFNDEDLDRLTRLLERFSLCLIRHEDSGGRICLRCAAYCEEGCSVGRARGGCPYQRTRETAIGKDPVEEGS